MNAIKTAKWVSSGLVAVTMFCSGQTAQAGGVMTNAGVIGAGRTATITGSVGNFNHRTGFNHVGFGTNVNVNAVGFNNAGVVGFNNLGGGVVGFNRQPHFHLEKVVTFETRTQKVVTHVTKIDHLGRSFVVPVVTFKTVQVPVTTFVKIFH